jgi:hypothetical protein
MSSAVKCITLPLNDNVSVAVIGMGVVEVIARRQRASSISGVAANRRRAFKRVWAALPLRLPCGLLELYFQRKLMGTP